MQAWWWRSVAACGSVLVVAGLVTVLAAAATADSAAPPPVIEAVAAPAPPTDQPLPPPAPDEVRAASPAATVSVAVADWRVVGAQTVIEVPAGRFDTVLARGEGAVVLIGRVDPARVPDVADPATADRAALDGEARRLADAYAAILGPDADRVTPVSDDDRPIADLPTSTAVRRVEGGGDVDGALVRVSTVAVPGRTAALLAVARPGPTQDADATDADTLVRSLRLSG